jgi:hypothetical protein
MRTNPFGSTCSRKRRKNSSIEKVLGQTDKTAGSDGVEALEKLTLSVESVSPRKG